jgi:hypothetical protein
MIASMPGGGILQVNWTAELSGLATTADLAQILVIPTLSSDRSKVGSILSVTDTTRAALTANISILPSITNFMVVVYFKGVGTASGHYSITKSQAVNL